ncbi:C-type lectin 37Db-like [Drosophila kikkawai]|uniref:C-type lectin 37Db-like n=1 Tax=Drosophila kikkawai TaxID=30033 RepID=A0A6P4ISP3_DROKI|nr:C-type lectin 37Db-like [Drosophila kikkawai]KAH8341224.1 hypothetical protein KR059_000312 [Drosophila kikkawai]
MAVTRPLFACVVLTLALGIQAKNCSENFTSVGNKCYYVSLKKENWYVADRTCRKLGGYLAVFDNEKDKTLTTEYLKSLGLPFADGWRHSVWIGINCLGNRRNFHLSKTGDPPAYLPWVRHQPDNYSPEEDCVAFADFNQSFGYHDIECDKQFPFVCEAPGTDDYLCLVKDSLVEAALYLLRNRSTI